MTGQPIGHYLTRTKLNAQAFSSILCRLIARFLTMSLVAPAFHPASTGKPRRPKSYAQAAVMQTVLEADIVNPATKPQIRAACVRAWDILEERKRILRGRPLPGHLRPDLPASQRKPTKRQALLATVNQEDKESLSDQGGSGHPTPQGA